MLVYAAGNDMKRYPVEASNGGPLREAVPLTRSPSGPQGRKLRRWKGADGPAGEGATQFHGVFSADVSAVTHARVQFGQ